MHEFNCQSPLVRAALSVAGASMILGACASPQETAQDPASTFDQEGVAEPVGVAGPTLAEGIECVDTEHPVETHITNPEEPIDLVVTGDSMVATSARKTHEIAEQEGVNVQTIAQKGAELQELRDEIDAALSDNETPVVIFLGTNNAATLNQCGDSLQDFQEVAAAAEAHGQAGMITVSENLPGNDTEAAAKNAAARDINEIIEPVSSIQFETTLESGNVFEADDLDWRAASANEELLKDGVHPNGYGSYHLATMYINFLQHHRATNQ